MGSHRTFTLSLTAVAAILAAATFSPVRAQNTPASAGSSVTLMESGLTKPYEERKLQFNQPGVVMEVKVKPGEAVKEGQVLAQQDISIEEAEREALDIEAKSTVQEEFARADKGVNEQKYKRLKNLEANKNANFLEIEEARLSVEKSNASIKIAVEERAKAAAKIKSIDARIALKT